MQDPENWTKQKYTFFLCNDRVSEAICEELMKNTCDLVMEWERERESNRKYKKKTARRQKSIKLMRPELRQTFNLSSPIFSFVLFCSLLVSTQWNVCHQAVVIIASSKMDACTLCSNHCCCYSPSQQNATQMYVMPRIDVCVYDSIRIYQLFFPSLPLARFHSSSTLNCVVWNKTYIPLLTQFFLLLLLLFLLLRFAPP